MKKLFFAITGALIFLNADSQGFPTKFGGGNTDIGRAIATDATGNVYSTGSFNFSADFDPGPGTFNLSSAGSSDIYISKQGISGSLVWAVSFGAAGADEGYSIAVDATGNVYVTGLFFNTVDFDPGAGTFNLVSAGNADIFVVKLDASGALVWAKRMGGAGADGGNGITLDAAGNVYTTGYFNNNVDFDPNAGVVTVVNKGGYDAFVSKLNNSGNLVWARDLGGTSTDLGYAIAVDATGNVYTTGYFTGTGDFDPGATVLNLVSAGSQDVYVSKLNSTGDLVWAKALGGGGSDFSNAIAVDAAGNVHVAGQFSYTADFDPGAATYSLSSVASTVDVFVCKLNMSGDFVWASAMGGNANDAATGLALDASGNVYTTGNFTNTADFDPGAAVFNLVTVGLADIFISKLDASGNFVWAKSFGGTNNDAGYALTIDNVGRIYNIGTFYNTVDFDPGAAVKSMTSTGGIDIFINRLTDLGVLLPLKLLGFSGRQTNSGNYLQWQTADELNTRSFVLETSPDATEFTTVATIASKGNGANSYEYTDKEAPSTVAVYYRLKMTDIDGKFTYSPVIHFYNSDASVSAMIHPNPVHDNATLQVKNKKLLGTTANLVNGNGTVILRVFISGELVAVDLHNLKAGYYILQFADGSSQKIIKR